jgi:hypothetical protein
MHYKETTIVASEQPPKHRLFSLRLPRDMFNQLERAAEEDHRSINAEIVYAVELLLAARKERGDA